MFDEQWDARTVPTSRTSRTSRIGDRLGIMDGQARVYHPLLSKRRNIFIIMKKNKRFMVKHYLPILMVVVLLISIFVPILNISASGVGSTTVAAGETFELVISVESSRVGGSNNVYLFYDKDAFEYVSVASLSASVTAMVMNREPIDGTEGTSPSMLPVKGPAGGCRVAVTTSASVTGELIEVTLRAKVGAEAKSYEIDAAGVYGLGTEMNATSSKTAVTVTSDGAGGGNQTPCSCGVVGCDDCFGVCDVDCPCCAPTGPGPAGIDTAAGWGGTITAAPGGNYTVTATAAGYVIDEVWVDGVKLTGVGGNGVTAYTTATAPTKSIFATFAHTINFLNPANGTLSVSRGGISLTSGDIVRDGDILTITAAPSADYELDTLVFAGMTDNGDGTYTVLAPRGGPTPEVSVTFKPESASQTTYRVTYIFSYGGAAITTPPTAAEGETVTLRLTPINNYRLVSGSLKVDDGNVSTEGTASLGREPSIFTFTMPARDVSYSAVFEPDLHSIAVQYGIANGELILSSASAVPGATITVYANPDPGYRLKPGSLSVNGGEVSIEGIGNQHRLTMPQGPVTITAEFEEAPTPWQGAGVNGDPYLIESKEDLMALRDIVNTGATFANMHFLLTADVDISGADWVPIGANVNAFSNNTPENTFSGIFDGGGHTVSGLTINNTEGSVFGLFGYASGAEIRNITVRGLITQTDIVARAYRADIGGIVGRAEATDISGCVSFVDVTVHDGYIGGIAGEVSNGSVYDSVNYGSLTAVWPGMYGNIGGVFQTDGNTARGSSAGGITASLSDSFIERCVNYGDITFIGGHVSSMNSQTLEILAGNYQLGSAACIAAQVSGSRSGVDVVIDAIRDSANKGNISGDMQYAGGIVAYSPRSIAITNCYNTGAITHTGTASSRGAQTRFGGLVGTLQLNTQYTLDIINSYSTGAVTILRSEALVVAEVGELHASGFNTNASTPRVITITNSYGPSNLASITAAQLGPAYKDDINNINGGFPLLVWEAGDAGTETQTVTFAVSPSGAEVKLFSDSARTLEIAAESSGVYSLTGGIYYYAVSADGYVTETGDVRVVASPVTVNVTLTPADTVTFTVYPADAVLTVTGGTGDIQPISADGGVYVFSLYSGLQFAYTAEADGHSGITRSFTAADGANIFITLTPSQAATGTVRGGETITQGGVYRIERNAGTVQGIITINTTEPVTLVGTGISIGAAYDNLYIRCTVPGVTLTLSDVFITNDSLDVSSNILRFTGQGNTLNLEGANILENNLSSSAEGPAVVRAQMGTSLDIGGGGTLYMYAGGMGAGFGGNSGEFNGELTFGAEGAEGPYIFAKTNHQGALIGSGSNAGTNMDIAGAIRFLSGDYYLIGNARGSIIGGGAGTTPVP